MEIVRIAERRSFFVLVGFLSLLYWAGCNGDDGDRSSKPGSGTPVTISGTVQYEDRTYDSTGFTGTTTKPIRKAVVEIVRDADGAILASGATGADGFYSLTFTNTGTAGVRVRVKAQTADDTVAVRNNSGALYAIVSLAIDDTAASSFPVDLIATRTTPGGPIFNILDVLLQGAEFVTLLAGSPPPLLIALWASGSCDGTYFNPADDTIHILGGCDNDTDEYDDPVLLHEYGHFIAAHYSRDDSQGGIHFLDDNTQDIRLSWSEGWGDFFPSAVRNDPLYVDTKGNVANIVFELEGPSSPKISNLSSLAIYTTNELSVASVLWDIFDSTPSEVFTNTVGTDAVSAGMTPIWDVASVYLCPTCTIPTVSFEDFWDGWFVRGHDLQAGMETVVADRKMALKADGFETLGGKPDDNSALNASAIVLGSSQSHTLYPSEDVDYVSFSATGGFQYTIETLGLTNGADTFLEVLGTNGTTVLNSNDDPSTTTKSSTCSVNFITQQSNCPPNDATTLASKVTFTPSPSGTYYARVKRSPSAPPSAGIYGGYQIRVTSP